MISNFKLQISNSSRGASTLEMLVAMSIMVIAISTVLPLVAGSQGVAISSQTTQEGLYKAQAVLENARAVLHQDYSLVQNCDDATATQCAGPADAFYNRKLSIVPGTETQCGQDIKSTASWTIDSRLLTADLLTHLGNLVGVRILGSDCEASPPPGGWTLPTTLGQIDLGPGQEATGIDVIHKIVFLSAEASAAAKPDFFIVDATDGASPLILSSINTGPGLNGVDVALNETTGEIFAYVINNKTSEQLQIIDTDAANNFANPAVISSIDLEPSPLGTNSEGRSIYYYDKKVYVGTDYLPAIPPNPPRPEFQIFDVSNPAAPFWLGSYDVNHNIHSIVISGVHAYLATSDDDGEVWVLNINDSVNITFVSKFEADGTEDGESLYLIGNTLYLGREHAPSSRPDFYILNAVNPAIITVLGSKNLSLSPSTAKINSIRVSGSFAFLGTGDSNEEFQVFNISNPASISSPISAYNFPQEATGIDFENNIVYASVRSNDALRIIRPAQCADKLDDDADGKIDSADPECHSDSNPNNPASYNPEDDNEAA